RLLKRGLTLSAALAIAEAARGAAALPVAPASARAVALADAVLWGMALGKWKLPGLMLVLLTLTAAAAGSLVPGENPPYAPHQNGNKPTAVRTGQDVLP